MSFGGWSIELECFKAVRQLLPAGRTILELGSGWATRELAKHYSVVSIEHDKERVGAHAVHYVHAPLAKGWYDCHVLQAALAGLQYDLLLVDGPPASVNAYARLGLLAHWNLFDPTVVVILDDVDRPVEHALAQLLGRLLEREPKIYNGQKKRFAVI